MTGKTNSNGIYDGSITRAKLARDALIVPTKPIRASRNIEANDLASTLYPSYSSGGSSYVITISQTVSATLPNGFYFAVTGLYANQIPSLTFTGVRLLVYGEGWFSLKSSSKTLKIDDVGGKVACEKLVSDNTNGDVWLVTGNVEVVS